MADSVQRHGRDTFVSTDIPNAPRGRSEVLLLQSGVARVYVYQPMPGIRGRRIEQAILSDPVKGTAGAQTLTASPVTERWSPADTTYNDQPAVDSGAAVTAAQGALTDGERIEIDVTDHVQAIADGAENWGWRITTNSASVVRLYAFNDPDVEAWVLSIDFADDPEPPTDLHPNGSVVAVEPVLRFDFTDLGGDSTDLAAVKVQVNTTASSSGAWDSGWVDSVVPEFDLAASAWPTTPTSGVTYYWRVYVKDSAGEASAPSDWASFTYVPFPSLVIDNPATGTAWDPSPTFGAHVSSGVIKAWRLRIARHADKSDIIYDSGKKAGNGTDTFLHTIPFRDDDGRRILKDDVSYWANFRVWDRNDRAAPGWIQEWVEFTFDDDATPPRPTDLTLTQVGSSPRIRLRWYRATGVPEGWVIRRDGEVIARLDPDEVDANDNVYEWVDNTAAPFVQHEYTVKVIDGDKQSLPSDAAFITPNVEGVWLLSDQAGDVVFDGLEVSNLRTTDTRATYTPLASQRPFDIVHALGGRGGTYQGTFDDEAGQDWWTARTRVLAMKAAPHREVQLVYASTSVPVKLRNVDVAPSPDFDVDTKRQDVVFEAYQTSDFEVS
jgi:hypothetical protein